MTQPAAHPDTIRIDVLGLPLTANERLRLHPLQLYKATRHMAEVIYWQAFQYRPPKPHLRVRIVVTLARLARDPERDPDGLAISCKEMIDAIVRAGVVVDDGPKHLDLEVRQEIGPKRRTAFTIIPLVRA